jgi:hypothetical protein
MFTSQDWDQLIADHLPPNMLVVAVDETDGVGGYTAVHPGMARCSFCSFIPATPVAG